MDSIRVKGGDNVKTLLIYDNQGYILSTRSGQPSPREPQGVPFLWVDIPEGKQIKYTDGIGVDVTTTPHEVFLEDIPPSETKLLEQRLEATEEMLLQIMLEGMM